MTDEKPQLRFGDAEAFRSWLSDHHAEPLGIWMQIAKKDSRIATVSYSDAVDTALCFGWIDGQKRPLDSEFYLQAFTPRRARSVWSQRNVERVAQLIAERRMHPAGLAAVTLAKADGRWANAYAGSPSAEPPEDFLAALGRNPRALEFYQTLNAVNRYAIYFRLQTAKRPETRERRIAAFVEMLARGEKFH